MRRRKLYGLEQATLEVLKAAPGLDASQIMPVVNKNYPAYVKSRQSSVSAALSGLTRFKLVNRVRSGKRFVYYDKGYQLPEGTVLANKMTRYNKKKDKQVVQQVAPNLDPSRRYPHITGIAADMIVNTSLPKRKDKLSIQDSGVLITIQWGKNESHTVSIEQAKEIHSHLCMLFGG